VATSAGRAPGAGPVSADTAHAATGRPAGQLPEWRTAGAARTPCRAAADRGRLRIYLGYAPGAGTTWALLSEGRRHAEQGTDVVVAHAETRGRPLTERLLAGLEVIPPVLVAHRGALVTEMDLGTVLARAPQVALVDDLAHRNAPGARHAQRWRDVEDLLAAGIEVISTVSIGHLDSLADVVAKITGAAPRQTVPDPVVRAADEVQLVDLVPEALRERMAGGHLYPVQQAEAALASWFQAGSLSALRELALLWLAATLASHPRRDRHGGHPPGSGPAGGPVVVALSGGPADQTLIRRAARITARSGAELIAVHVTPLGGTTRQWPCRARRPARADPVARWHLPPGDWRGRLGRAAGIRARGKCHPAGAWRNPAHLVSRATPGSQHQLAGSSQRGRNRCPHRHPHPRPATPTQPVAS